MSVQREGRSVLIALPFWAVGVVASGYGGVALYSGYASKDWPHCKAVATDFQIKPVQNQILNIIHGGDTHDYVVDFEYTIPDPQSKKKTTYVGTSGSDPNFPVRLSLNCPPCRVQAEQITKYFSKKGRKFRLYYDPSPPNIPYVTQRKRKPDTKSKSTTTQQEIEGLFPLYTLDPGAIAEVSYHIFGFGIASLVTAASATKKSWRKLLWSDLSVAGGVVSVAILVGAGITYVTAKYLEWRLEEHWEERDKEE